MTQLQFYGCTQEQLNKHLKANAEILRKMATKAEGKKYNGFTREQLNHLAEGYENSLSL